MYMYNFLFYLHVCIHCTSFFTTFLTYCLFSSFLSLSLTPAPSVSPSGINIVRSNDGTNMTITWVRVTLEDARGFFEYVIIIVVRSNRKRQTVERIRVPSTETSYTATGLDDQATYGVSMGLSVDDGSGRGPVAGPMSETMEISSPG